MPKNGKEKNTKNKSKHTKLITRKLNKQREEKIQHEFRLKELVRKHQEQKMKNSTDL
ncbi:hypothetical protein ACFLRU_07370 [Bacteroidota bacterium]